MPTPPGPRTASVREGCCHDPSATCGLRDRSTVDLPPTLRFCGSTLLPSSNQRGSTIGSPHAPGRHSLAATSNTVRILSHAPALARQRLRGALLRTIRRKRFLLRTERRNRSALAAVWRQRSEILTTPGPCRDRFHAPRSDWIREASGREYLRKRGSKPYWLESARNPGTFSTVAGGWRPPSEHGFW